MIHMNKRGLAAKTCNELKLSFPSLSVNEGIARSGSGRILRPAESYH